MKNYEDKEMRDYFVAYFSSGDSDERYDENGFLKPEYEDEYEDDEEEEQIPFFGWFENQNVSDEVLALEDSLYD